MAINVEDAILPKDSFTVSIAYPERVERSVAFKNPFAALIQRQSTDIVIDCERLPALAVPWANLVRYAVALDETEAWSDICDVELDIYAYEARVLVTDSPVIIPEHRVNWRQIRSLGIAQHPHCFKRPLGVVAGGLGGSLGGCTGFARVSRLKESGQCEERRSGRRALESL